MVEEKEVIEVLKEVYDPEIPINVYDLGLIYQIEISYNEVRILMTFTSPNCPVGDYLKELVKEAVSSVEGVEDVEVDVTFDPPWSPSMVNSSVKEDLGLEDNELNTTPFFSTEKSEEENYCFNCLVSENEIPLLKVTYKKEESFLCTRCVSKF